MRGNLRPKHAAIVIALSSLLLLLPATGARASLVESGSTLGGATAPTAPVLSDTICSAGCVALRRATVGGSLQVTGRNLGLVTVATFPGREGRIRVTVKPGSDSSVTVPVPPGARSGRILVGDAFGNRSKPSPPVTIESRSVLKTSGPLELTGAETVPRRAYFFGVKRPRLAFVVNGARPVNDLRIDVVNSAGEIVRSYFRAGVPRNTTQSIRWDGRTSAGGPAPGGKYSFRVSARSGERARLNRKLVSRGRQSQATAATNPLGFELYGYAFPVLSRVSWGDGIGAGRNHQGQDLMAACGTPVVAARGGKVVYKGDLSGAAGNYIVISGKASGYDFAYMHLLRPVRFRVGDTIRTGQVIGRVGSTGRSSACHLHFEMWTAPGLYKGGSPISPAQLMRRWYRQ